MTSSLMVPTITPTNKGHIFNTEQSNNNNHYKPPNKIATNAPNRTKKPKTWIPTMMMIISAERC